MGFRRGGSTVTIVGAAVAVVVVVLAVVVSINTTNRAAGPSIAHVTTTIFISASCTRSTAITNGNSTTTYVSSFIGNLTVATTASGFSTNATAICK